MSIGVVVRDAVESDLRRCVEMMDLEHGGGEGRWRANLKADLANPRRDFVVAERSDVVVGLAQTCFVQDEPPGTSWRPEGWYVCGVCVEPQLRRRGIGRLLVASLVAKSRRMSERPLYCMVEENNVGSLALHRSLGFRDSGLVHPPRRQRMLLLRLELCPSTVKSER